MLNLFFTLVVNRGLNIKVEFDEIKIEWNRGDIWLFNYIFKSVQLFAGWRENWQEVDFIEVEIYAVCVFKVTLIELEFGIAKKNSKSEILVSANECSVLLQTLKWFFPVVIHRI